MNKIVRISTQKASTEVSVLAPLPENPDHLIVLGIALHPHTKNLKVIKDFVKLTDDREINKKQAGLRKFLSSETHDRTSDEYYDEKDRLEDELLALQTRRESEIELLHKKAILYLKNVPITVISETGEEVQVIIPDSRTYVDESLWLSPEECRAVLLDIILEDESLRDSIFSKLSNGIFSGVYASDIASGKSVDTETHGELKVKN